jgi:hypothetical protein
VAAVYSCVAILFLPVMHELVILPAEHGRDEEGIQGQEMRCSMLTLLAVEHPK